MLGEDFGKYFFTIDPIESAGHPTTMMDGILFGIQATDIKSLKPKQDGQQFFENQVSIEPNVIMVNEMQQLMVHRETITIQNTANKANFTVVDIFTSSPEIVILSDDGSPMQFPIRLKPSENLRVTVMIIPETLELIDAAIYFVFNPRYIYMMPVSVFVVENMFGLRPIYYTNVNIRETIKTKIRINNPFDKPIVIQEAYSTEEFV